MAEVDLSVVIPTFNRAALLDRALTALDAQQGAPGGVEVIVVDDGSTDATSAVVARHAGVVHVRQAHAGAAAARNTGWRRAGGSVVAFTDDDTVPCPRWLADLAAAFADPDLDAAGGVVEPLRRSFLTLFVQAEQHASHGVGADGAIHYLVTANCAYRRSALVALGGFDEGFRGASGEDTDLTLRAIAAGLNLRLLDGAVVLHDHPDRVGAVMRGYVKHGGSRRLVAERNPGAHWSQGRRRVLSAGHWRHRYRSYRQVGLGPVGAAGGIGLRLAGLAAYAGGVARSRPPATSGPGCESVSVAIACPGADHVARGYERVARDLFALLDPRRGVDVELLKGSRIHRSAADVVLPCLRRDRRPARWMSRLLSPPALPGAGAPPEARRSGRGGLAMVARVLGRQVPVTPYELESLTFGVSLLAWAALYRPDVLVLQDVLTAKVVRAGRVVVPGWRTRTLFVNGTPWPPPFRFADVVQHVSPVTWEEDPARGWRKVLLPLGTTVPALDGVACSGAQRRRFGLPERGPVVVSIGTMVDSHKRHLHLISEVARLPEPRPYLILAGAPGPDGRLIEAAARDLLGHRQRVVQVEPDEVAALLGCADVFALASVREGFGLAYVEALAAGLPVVAHDGPLQRWILGPFGDYVDMAAPGALACAIEAALRRNDRWTGADARRAYAAQRFSWEALADDYLDLIRRTSRGPVA